MTSRAGVMGMGGRYKDEGGMKGEAGGRVRPATVASCVLCLRRWFFLALCCLGKIPGGAPFSQLHKGGKQRRVDRP